MKTPREEAENIYSSGNAPDLEMQIEAYVCGYESCKQKCEDKNRWIPVEEELPPIDSDVILKYIDRGKVAYWAGTLNTELRREHFLKKHLLFTHWRPIEIQ